MKTMKDGSRIYVAAFVDSAEQANDIDADFVIVNDPSLSDAARIYDITAGLRGANNADDWIKQALNGRPYNRVVVAYKIASNIYTEVKTAFSRLGVRTYWHNGLDGERINACVERIMAEEVDG